MPAVRARRPIQNRIRWLRGEERVDWLVFIGVKSSDARVATLLDGSSPPSGNS